ncbi:MAG: glutamate formimidoyltransferase [Proteobacteria bacterium]|jgi:glutamate formiminotransferase/formiminotetrahydrofolate cyclodeaminase|nr:glutamate formimidoyltransferase [Pseudomonadota bacterium]
MRLVECVPNISEGRDRRIIDAVAAEVETVDGVRLLDVDPGATTNRTVITFVGSPEAAAEAAFRLIRRAAELIDMRGQRGEHPRNGATDVCPFVPLTGVTMADCAELARRVGARVGTELGIPVYLYEHAASKPEWRNLATIRKGEYEALPQKLGKPEWKPDFGPNEWSERVAKTGATQVGARQFLIAYNINLNTKNTKLAKRIGLVIREQGGAVKRDASGNKLRGPSGELLKHEKGLFDHCKATGWFIEEFGCAQVTMNLTDYTVTPPHLVFDKVCEIAAELGLRVTGSELVGLIPLEAVLAAGRHYLRKQGASDGVPEADLIEAAHQSMSLSQISKFSPDERIVEYRVRTPRPLVERTAAGFVDELSRDSAAPGGGSVAALCGALGAGLATMVANLTVGKTGYEAVEAEMIGIAEQGQALKDLLVRAVDDDTFAFNEVMAAFAVPKGAARDAAIAEANKKATLVPLSVLEAIPAVVELAGAAGARGNRNSLSDAGVAVLAARTAATGAYYNVLINSGQIGDAAFVSEVRGRADAAFALVTKRCDELDMWFRSELQKKKE